MRPIRIRYCETWNYLPRASRVAALIKKETGLDSALEVGGRGELSVWVGEQKVVDKSSRGFPSDAALITAVKQAIALE